MRVSVTQLYTPFFEVKGFDLVQIGRELSFLTREAALADMIWGMFAGTVAALLECCTPEPRCHVYLHRSELRANLLERNDAQMAFFIGATNMSGQFAVATGDLGTETIVFSLLPDSVPSDILSAVAALKKIFGELKFVVRHAKEKEGGVLVEVNK